MWDNFVDLFSRGNTEYDINTIYVTDIYPASELPRPNITSKNLVEAIKLKNPNLNIINCSTYNEIEKHLKNTLNKDDLLITLGAGKVNKLGEALIFIDKS